MADIRNTYIPGIWAQNAQTTIPEPPVSGQSYRQATPSPDDWRFGQAYDRLADSARYNELWHIITTLLQQLEQNGVLPYSQNTNYNSGALCIGTDNVIYQALQPSGPANGGAQATNNTAYWKKPLVQVTYSGSTSITVPANGGAISLKIDPSGGLGVGANGVFVNPDTFSTEIINELLKQLRLPQWLVAGSVWFVRPDGNDDNDGKGNSADRAFRTIQAALNHVSENFNFGRYNGTIQAMSGIYTENLTLPKYSSSTGVLYIIGESENTTRIIGGITAAESAGKFYIQKIAVQSPGVPLLAPSNARLILVPSAVTMSFSSFSLDASVPIEGGGVTFPFTVNGGTLVIQNDVTVNAAPSGNCYSVFEVTNGLVNFNKDMTVNGAVSRAFVDLYSLAVWRRVSTPGEVFPVINGTVTGKRYSVTQNSICNTLGGGANFLPGTEAGTTASGGQYV